MSFLAASLDWCERRLAWSNTWPAWQGRLGILFLVLGTGVGGLAGYGWTVSTSRFAQTLLSTVLILTVSSTLIGLALLLFSPVLFYDLVRIARRRRYIVLRCLYAMFLALLLGWMYLLLWLEHRHTEAIAAREMAAFAEWFFFTFMCVQFVVVGILTPGYTAGAIAEEKERKTLEFILATDLHSREIVLSKLAARVANLTQMLLTGLPILSFIQFFGGIDPGLLLAGFAALALTTMGLAAMSILASVYSKKARDAIVLTYLTAAVYLGVSSLCLLLLGLPTIAGFDLTFSLLPVGWGTVTIADLVDWVNSGNLLVALGKLIEAYERGRNLVDTLPLLLRNYAIFHGLLTIVCSTWAVLRMRPVALAQAFGSDQGPTRLQRGVNVVLVSLLILGLVLLPVAGWIMIPLFRPWTLLQRDGQGKTPSLWVRLRPPVGRYPMIWKEVLAEPGLRFNWAGRIVVSLLVIVSFVPAGIILIEFVREHIWFGNPTARWSPYRNIWEELSWSMNAWVRTVGTIVSCLTLLGVAVRASGTVSGERDRQTLDELLTTPLDSNTILIAKWLGSILSVRWAWIWLGLIWAVGILTGGLHILALPLVVSAWLTYAAMFASIGIWYSVVSQTTLRATIWTLLTVVGISVGHWLVMSMCCYMPLAILATGSGRDVEWLLKIQFGQTPPAVLAWLSFNGLEFRNGGPRNEVWEMTASSLFGIFSWSVAAVVIWAVASARFRVLTHRSAFLRPERPEHQPRPQRTGSRPPRSAPEPLRRPDPRPASVPMHPNEEVIALPLDYLITEEDSQPARQSGPDRDGTSSQASPPAPARDQTPNSEPDPPPPLRL